MTLSMEIWDFTHQAMMSLVSVLKWAKVSPKSISRGYQASLIAASKSYFIRFLTRKNRTGEGCLQLLHPLNPSCPLQALCFLSFLDIEFKIKTRDLGIFKSIDLFHCNKAG